MRKMSVVIDYTNWRGERSIRRIQPVKVSFEENPWHRPAQWLLEAIDLDDKHLSHKTFALSNIHSWKPEEP
jgi:predicted DNA-binding transcriptional regulator YafY